MAVSSMSASIRWPAIRAGCLPAGQKWKWCGRLATEQEVERELDMGRGLGGIIQRAQHPGGDKSIFILCQRPSGVLT